MCEGNEILCRQGWNSYCLPRETQRTQYRCRCVAFFAAENSQNSKKQTFNHRSFDCSNFNPWYFVKLSLRIKIVGIQIFHAKIHFLPKYDEHRNGNSFKNWISSEKSYKIFDKFFLQGFLLIENKKFKLEGLSFVFNNESFRLFSHSMKL